MLYRKRKTAAVLVPVLLRVLSLALPLAAQQERTRYVKNAHGQLLDWATQTGGTKNAHDSDGRPSGWYNHSANQTYDSFGRLLATSGDITDGLILQNNPKR